MSALLRVLLVDDSEDDYIITRDLFTQTEGNMVDLEWVDSYDAALERLGQKCHDVYIFDYFLGGRTGLELLQWAVEHDITAPVIMLTGHKDSEVDLLAMRAGAADYLVKGRTDALLLERTVRYASEHARRLETFRDLATRDELTGLYNRREMDRILDMEVLRCRRYDHPLSLVIIDIDNFKAINDTTGHKSGDTVLRAVSQLLLAALRSTDSLARYGGEELVVILPETPEEVALLVAERMRTMVEAYDFATLLPSVTIGGRLPHIELTVSLGVACTGTAPNTSDILFAAADRALYQAKRTGRNRVVSYATLPAQTGTPLPTTARIITS